MPAAHVERINAISELDRIGVEWESAGEDEISIKCPVHEDSSPSVGLNTVKNIWRCRASHCKAKGDIISLLAHILQVERSVVFLELGTRYDLEEVRSISSGQVEKWHQSIWEEAGPLLKALRDRGVTDEMIRSARLGFAKGRITIPVYDQNRFIINVRRYLPGAPGPEKMRNLPGFGKVHLYQVEQLKYDDIWILGGELKALVAGFLLNEHGIGCVSATAGEGNWDVRWNSSLKGKRVYLCMDVDAAGHAAARQIGNLIHREPEYIGVIHLPLDKKVHPKGDVNDYIGTEKATDSDLLQCMKDALEFEVTIGISEVVPDEVIQTNLTDAVSPDHVGRRVCFRATAIGVAEEPYYVPRKVRVSCSRDQAKCALCGIYLLEADPITGATEVEVSSTSKEVLNFIDLPDFRVPAVLQNLFGIPRCKVVSFSTLERSSIAEVLLQPEYEPGDIAKEVNRSAYVLGKEPELNSAYDFEAVVWEHPRTQKAALLVVSSEQAGDNLSSFTETAQDLESLRVFQPKDWTVDALRDKIAEIHNDLAAHVTRIYCRPSLHLIIDLTYHSVLSFELDGKTHGGWVNSLVLGDTAQGKSETVDGLQRFYQLGGRADCKNATPAGLLGGVQQVGTRWFVSWGQIPRHDRGFVALEEVKGASIETIGRLTDMRSRGIATIDKVIQRKISARTRLLFLSNARGGRPLAEYAYGVETVPELIGAPEDVRRFDAALILDRREIEGKVLEPPDVEHTLDSDLSRRLILWCWTRTIDQVVFEDEGILEEKADRLISLFNGAIPLIDDSTARIKLARLSIALAGRTFSIDDSLEVLVVRKCHVEAIATWLENIYSSDACGLKEFTQRFRRATEMSDPVAVSRTINETRYPKDFAIGLLSADQITPDDIATWTSMSPDLVRGVLSALVRKNALRRVPGVGRNTFSKTPGFIRLLKTLETSAPNEHRLKDEPGGARF